MSRCQCLSYSAAGGSESLAQSGLHSASVRFLFSESSTVSELPAGYSNRSHGEQSALRAVSWAVSSLLLEPGFTQPEFIATMSNPPYQFFLLCSVSLRRISIAVFLLSSFFLFELSLTLVHLGFVFDSAPLWRWASLALGRAELFPLIDIPPALPSLLRGFPFSLERLPLLWASHDEEGVCAQLDWLQKGSRIERIKALCWEESQMFGNVWGVINGWKGTEKRLRLSACAWKSYQNRIQLFKGQDDR